MCVSMLIANISSISNKCLKQSRCAIHSVFSCESVPVHQAMLEHEA